MASEKMMDKPLPSLADWLGDGRADGFEEWVKETVYLERAVNTPREAAAVRMSQTFSIAVMETLRREQQRPDVDEIDAVLLLSRVAGAAIMGALASILDHQKSPPYLRIARMFAEEFGVGAKSMASSIIASNPNGGAQ